MIACPGPCSTGLRHESALEDTKLAHRLLSHFAAQQHLRHDRNQQTVFWPNLNGHARLPVVDLEGRLVGVVRHSDALAAGLVEGL